MIARITEAIANDIIRLHEDRLDEAEIAQLLNLKKMQVKAILAYFRPSKGDDAAPYTANEPSDGIESDANRMGSDSLSGSAIVQEYSASAPNADLHKAEVVDVADSKEKDETEEDAIFIGNDKEFADALYWNPQNAAAVQNPHMMIVGESGSGKTYSVQCLTAELAQRGLPTIIFDYAQGFELDNLDEVYKKYVRVREYRIGEDGISLNPLQIFPKDVKGPASVATRVSDVFDAVYHFGHIQRKVLIEAITVDVRTSRDPHEHARKLEARASKFRTFAANSR